jgi:iron complex outermembrane receptor protein
MNRVCTLLILLFSITFAFGQVTITGTVYLDGEGEAIGSNVVIEGNERVGTVTEFDGIFALEVDSLPVTLKISYTGYPTQRVTISSLDENIIITFKRIISESPLVTIINSRLYHSANYSIITPEDLKLNNSATVLSGMNTAPGIHIHSGSLNTNRITIRGIGNRSRFTTAKIRAYLDDIPLTSGVGETSLEDIDVDLLSSIKIVKGPNVSNYGSGLGGSIIMRTENNDKRNFAQTKFEAGSYGLLRSSSIVNVGTEKASFRAGYSKTHSDGYRGNNEYDRHNFTLLNETNYSNKGRLNFLLNITDLKAFIPSSLSEEDYLNEPEKAAFTWNKVKGFEDYNKIQVGASHRITGNNINNTSSIFGTFFNSYESRPFNILRENSRALGARTKFDFSFNTFGNQSLIKFGAEYFNEKYDWQTFETLDGILGPHLSDNIENRQYYNIFAEADWRFMDNLTIETGINFNATKYDLQDFYFLDSMDVSGNYQFDPVISPRLGINYYWAQKGISFFGNASHGFNPPNLEETLTPDGNINPDIQPETGWNFEIGSRGNVVWRSLSYNVSLYYMKVKDLLVERQLENNQSIGINAGRTSHLGLELDLNYKHNFDKIFINPFINYHFAHYQFDEFIDGDNDYSGNTLTGAIPHKINAGLKAEMTIGLYGNAIYQFVDQMPMRDDNSIYSDSYNTMDIKLGYAKSFGQNKNKPMQKWIIDVYAGIRNIWNEKYASQILINASSFGGNAPRYYYPGLPRNYYGGLSLKYAW